MSKRREMIGRYRKLRKEELRELELDKRIG